MGEEIVEEKGRTSVKMTYTMPGASNSDDEDDEEEEEEEEDSEPITTVLCSLTPGKVCPRYACYCVMTYLGI